MLVRNSGELTKGLKVYSNDVLVDADLELTDIEPEAKQLIYQFVGESSEFTAEELGILLELSPLPENKREKVIEFLLYYGFLGIRYADQDVQYIYQVGYDMQIFQTRLSKNKGAIRYVLNPAFWPALNISPV